MEFRALQPREMNAWYDHVTSVFRGSRQYFMNHWENDPWQDVEGIRVAVENGKFTSTVRVFIRQMYLNGEKVAVGGIGEVSTLPEYRRLGLATRLLQDAIRFMEEREIAISSLHGGQRIYSVEGWERIPRYFARERMPAKSDDTFHIRPIDFQSPKELEQLAALYDGYSRRFNGTFVRDHSRYWQDWVRTESPQAWVAEQDGEIKGYTSIGNTEERLFVKEFVASEDMFTRARGKRIFDALIGWAITHIGRDTHEVMFPAPVADGFNAKTVEQYGSTMYRTINRSQLPEHFKSLPNLLHRQPETWDGGIASHHVFWNTDGF